MNLVTIGTLATRCDVPFDVAYHWVQFGQIPSVKLGKTRYAYLAAFPKQPSA
ncbi:conserved protein of unknown function [Pseudomonas marincola]|uniref:DNA-binding protein n=1 Tax=Pseudomonas marincola TaxID=437900 RepID=A0A653E316_9PSED|nr:hypothetical protein [Pseudomonas marincola]CAE6888801.1 conserved protein of unknown function [Pseudomonas marincola]